MTTKFTTRFNYKPQKGIENTEESKTFQECKDDCDINSMYRKYLSKGFEPPNVAMLEARYGDISTAKSYEEMLNVKEDVNQLFNSLPATIRESCDYDVDTFMEVIGQPHDDKDVQKFQGEIFDQLGMLERKEVFAEIQQAVSDNRLPDVDTSEQPKTEI